MNDLRGSTGLGSGRSLGAEQLWRERLARQVRSKLATMRSFSVRKGGSSKSSVGRMRVASSSMRSAPIELVPRPHGHASVGCTASRNNSVRGVRMYGASCRVLSVISGFWPSGCRALSVLQQFGEWLEAEAPRVLPKHPIREALDYARNQWPALYRYAQRGCLAIDNNSA